MNLLILSTLYPLGSNPFGPNTLNSLPQISFNEGLIIGFIIFVFVIFNNKKKIEKFYLGFKIRKANRLTKRVTKVKSKYLLTAEILLRDEISFVTQKRLRILVSLVESHLEQSKKTSMKTLNPYFFELISEIFECINDLMSVSECVTPSIFKDSGCYDVFDAAATHISENAHHYRGFSQMRIKELYPLSWKCADAMEDAKNKNFEVLEHKLNQMMIQITSMTQR